MLYSAKNAPGSQVYDVEANAEIRKVLLVNTETGSVAVAKTPIRLNHKGKIDRETIYFDSIRPIFGGGRYPCLFHCYGRQP